MNIISLVTTSYYEYPSNFTFNNISTSVNGWGTLFQYVTSSLGDNFGGGLLLSIAIIMFLTLKSSGFPASKSLAATSFACTLLATLLMMIGILSFTIVMICAIITLFMALIARSEANIGL